MRFALGPIALGFTVATGCNPNTAQHSSEYYFHHPKDAHARVEQCETLSLQDRDADCVNAQNGLAMATMHGTPSIKNPYAK